MGIITDLIPTNLTTEKAKFLADPSYNPQFTYLRQFTTADLTKYGLPDPQIISQLQDETLGLVPTKTIAPEDTLSQTQVKEKLTALFAELKVPPLEIRFDQQQSARTLINPARGYISFRLPLKITAEQFSRISAHEIQTHYLRSLNDQLQPWHQTKRSAKLWKDTEEGLAIYNSLLVSPTSTRTLDMIKLQYLLVDLALHHSFSQVYAFAQQYLPEESAFNLTYRVKRGLTDTSQPGAHTKGIVYYAGYLAINNFINQGGQLRDLYWGKIGVQEVDQLRSQAQTTALIYPLFY